MSLPTCYGESICYAILPSVFNMIKGRCMVSLVLRPFYARGARWERNKEVGRAFVEFYLDSG